MLTRILSFSMLSCSLLVGCADESEKRAPADSKDQLTTAPVPKNADKRSSKFGTEN